jgi:hypothetical protein
LSLMQGHQAPSTDDKSHNTPTTITVFCPLRPYAYRATAEKGSPS